MNRFFLINGKVRYLTKTICPSFCGWEGRGRPNGENVSVSVLESIQESEMCFQMGVCIVIALPQTVQNIFFPICNHAVFFQCLLHLSSTDSIDRYQLRLIWAANLKRTTRWQEGHNSLLPSRGGSQAIDKQF